MKQTEYWIRPGQGKVIALIHGIGAKDPQDYWQTFLHVLANDKQLQNYGLFIWKYPTHVGPAKWKDITSTVAKRTLRETAPRIKHLGAVWNTTYHTQFRNYQDVVLVGGLVIKSWIIDTLEQRQSKTLETLRHIAFYATPHNGAPITTLANWNKQLKDMQLDSPLIEDIGNRWHEHVVAWKESIPGPQDHLYNRYIPHLVIAGLIDRVVPSHNAAIRGMPLTTIQGDHSEVIQPVNTNDTRYKVWRDALDEALQAKSQRSQTVSEEPRTYQVNNEKLVQGQIIGDNPTVHQHFYGHIPNHPIAPEQAVQPKRVWNIPYPHNPFFTGRDLSKRKATVLIGIAFILIIGIIGFFSFIQPAWPNTSPTTAISTTNNPYFAGKSQLILMNPLLDNSKGNKWREDDSCTFPGDGYHFTTTIHNYAYYCTDESTSYTNFVYEVQMKILKGYAGGLIFRADGNNATYYYLRFDQHGNYRFIASTGHTSSGIIKEGTSSDFHIGLGQSNLIAVVANGSHISFYVNHKYIAKITDDTFTHGQIGFAASSDENSVEVVFNNTKVWSI